MTLLLQIILLVLGVGGTIVSAFALSNPWRFRLVVGFAVVGAIGLILTIATYEATPGVVHLSDLWRWLWVMLLDYAVAIQRLPGFWIVMAFVGGVAVHHWLPLLKAKLVSQPAGPQVKEWLSPKQAIEQFVSPELISKQRTAEKKASELRETIRLMEAELQGTKDAKREIIRSQINGLVEECNNLDYLSSHRRKDVFDNFYDQLISGFLVGKGRKVNSGNPQEKETYIKPHYWKIGFADDTILDLETGRFYNVIYTYQNVSIGKNEAPINPQASRSRLLLLPGSPRKTPP